MRPARIGAPFEMVEAEIVFELAILLFNRPAAPGEGDQVDERRGRREVEQVVLPFVGGRSFAEQPALASPRRGAHAEGTEPCGERTGHTGAPRHGLPGGVGCRPRNGHGGPVPGTPTMVNVASPRMATPYGQTESLEASAKGRIRAVVGVDHHASDREAAWRIARTCANAMRHFSRNRSVAGMRAAARRDASSVHATGT